MRKSRLTEAQPSRARSTSTRIGTEARAIIVARISPIRRGWPEARLNTAPSGSSSNRSRFPAPFP